MVQTMIVWQYSRQKRVIVIWVVAQTSDLTELIIITFQSLKDPETLFKICRRDDLLTKPCWFGFNLMAMITMEGKEVIAEVEG